MEILILFAFIITIILLLAIRSGQKELAARTEETIHSLRQEIAKFQKTILNQKKEEEPATDKGPDISRWKPYANPIQKEKIKEPVLPAPQEPTLAPPAFPTIPLQPKTSLQQTQQNKTHYVEPPTESWWERWLKNNPDLEKFVGENLVNKIGITVLVLGIAFFVKYAIDQNWINEVGRVSIGMVCGIALVAIAHYLRNSYRAFSSVMAGGGIAVFYFTIAFAFHQYQLFSQTVAFVIMIGITIFAVALSVLYDKIELAVIATVGGFLAPFLVSTGSGNYVVLFSYLLILSSGILLTAYFKKWPLLLALSFFFSWLIFDGWLLNEFNFDESATLNKNALLFATAFYFLFLITSLINNLRTQKPFKPFDFSLLLIISFSYYAQGMYILSNWNDGIYQGFFTIALALINLALAWYLFASQKGDKNLLYVLIGLTLTFVSLVAPVQLHGLSITVFWSAEAVLLYWLYQRSQMNIFKYSSLLVLFCMGLSLLLDWSIANTKSDSFLPMIFTNWKGIVTNIFAIACLGCYAVLLYRNEKNTDTYFGLKNKTAKIIFGTAALAVFYITCIFCVNLYFKEQESFAIPNAYQQLITYIFSIAILLFIKRANSISKPALPLALIAVCFIFYFASSGLANKLVVESIQKNHTPVHALAHWLYVLSLLYLLYWLVNIFRQHILALGDRFSWLISLAAVAVFSIECRLLYLSIFADSNTLTMHTSNYSKAGLTIIWGLFSFVIIWLGMKYKFKSLRIIALGIFTAALVKLFLFDIRNISEGGKIAAFIMLGILLLVISFMYQRLKKIIIDHEEKIS